MTQKDKELLLKDLCARLPHGTVLRDDNNPTSVGKLISLNIQYNLATFEVDNQTGELYTCPIEFVKLYLRPMSNMTRKEADEYKLFSQFSEPADVVDWLDKNMFDYRGLIPKGIALEAPEGMYKID